MVRVGGMTYTCTPKERIGRRISDLRIGGKPLDPSKRYKVAGWAPVAEGAEGEPVWELLERYLRKRKSIVPLTPNRPRLIGV
jgi:sulfur-oxidizing protein SoxB